MVVGFFRWEMGLKVMWMLLMRLRRVENKMMRGRGMNMGFLVWDR